MQPTAMPRRCHCHCHCHCHTKPSAPMFHVAVQILLYSKTRSPGPFTLPVVRLTPPTPPPGRRHVIYPPPRHPPPPPCPITALGECAQTPTWERAPAPRAWHNGSTLTTTTTTQYDTNTTATCNTTQSLSLSSLTHLSLISRSSLSLMRPRPPSLQLLVLPLVCPHTLHHIMSCHVM